MSLGVSEVENFRRLVFRTVALKGERERQREKEKEREGD